MSQKITLDKYVKVKSLSPTPDSAEDVLELNFLSENYVKHLSKINLDQNKNLTQVDQFKIKEPMKIEKQKPLNTIECPICKTLVDSEMTYCTNCGTVLKKVASISPQPIPAPRAGASRSFEKTNFSLSNLFFF